MFCESNLIMTRRLSTTLILRKMKLAWHEGACFCQSRQKRRFRLAKSDKSWHQRYQIFTTFRGTRTKVDTTDITFFIQAQQSPIDVMKKLSLLGLLAQIMCSICSFQLNIWNASHWGACILNWFLHLGHGIGACSFLATGWPAIALPPGSAHSPLGK